MKKKKLFLLFFMIISLSLWLSTFVCYGEDISFSDFPERIPVPGKSENFWPGRQIVELNNTNTEMYSYVNEILPPEKITEFYKNCLPKIGWQLMDYWPLMKVAHFEKRGGHLYIGATNLKAGCKFIILSSKEAVHVCLTYSNITSNLVVPDRPGKDMPIIPRMSDTTRLTSVIRKDPLGVPQEALLVYATRNSMVKIVNFYKSQLGNAGWSTVAESLSPAVPLGEEGNTANISEQKTARSNLYVAATVKFKKGKDAIFVSSYYCPDSDANIIIITFNFLGAGIPFNFGAGL